MTTNVTLNLEQHKKIAQADYIADNGNNNDTHYNKDICN